MRKALNDLIQHRHFQDGHSYDRHAGRVFRNFHERVATDVSSVVRDGGVVLDAGCGTGRVATRLARLRPDLQVRGVDLEPGMVEVARERAQRHDVADRVEFTAADLADLPWPDNSVDLIVSTASMHHWTDIGGIVTSLNRVLRPGGVMWIYDMRWVSPGSLRTVAAALGLRVERTLVRTGRFPFALFQRLGVELA